MTIIFSNGIKIIEIKMACAMFEPRLRSTAD